MHPGLAFPRLVVTGAIILRFSLNLDVRPRNALSHPGSCTTMSELPNLQGTTPDRKSQAALPDRRSRRLISPHARGPRLDGISPHRPPQLPLLHQACPWFSARQRRRLPRLDALISINFGRPGQTSMAWPAHTGWPRRERVTPPRLFAGRANLRWAPGVLVERLDIKDGDMGSLLVSVSGPRPGKTGRRWIYYFSISLVSSSARRLPHPHSTTHSL